MFKLSTLSALFLLLTAGAAEKTADLFPSRIVAKGKGVEVKSTEVEESLMAFKANRAAAGQTVPPGAQRDIQEQILDKLIATQLFLAKANETDRTQAKEIAGKFIADLKKQSPSETAFNRQLIAEGTTPEKFQAQVLEQAVVKSVIDREIKAKQNITPEQIEKFYKTNMTRFETPERLKVAHLLLMTKDPVTGQPASPEQRAAKLEKIQKLKKRIADGEDFAKLVKENTEDERSRDKGGEYVFARGEMPLEFEAAAWSLKPGQVSDIVTTQFGFHLIKTIEKLPAQTTELAKVQDKIKEALLQEAVQAVLPDYVEKMKKEAGVEIHKENLD